MAKQLRLSASRFMPAEMAVLFLHRWGGNIMRRLIILFDVLFCGATHELHIMMPGADGAATEYIAHDDSGE